MIFAHAGVAFALASLTRGALVELLHVSIEDANFFRARELRAGRRRPRAFVPTGKNQVGTVLILRLRHGEQLHARVRMIARGRTRGAKRRSRFFKPAQEEGAQKFRIETLRPIARDADNFERVLLPAEIRERGVSLFEKLCERAERRKKRQRAQCLGDRLKFLIGACGTEFAQNFEIVQQHFAVTFAQNFFEGGPAKSRRQNCGIGERV